MKSKPKLFIGFEFDNGRFCEVTTKDNPKPHFSKVVILKKKLFSSKITAMEHIEGGRPVTSLKIREAGTGNLKEVILDSIRINIFTHSMTYMTVSDTNY